MRLKDLTISAKLTLTTTSVVLIVFLLMSTGILLSLNGIYDAQADHLKAAAAQAPTTEGVDSRAVQAAETAGVLFTELVAANLGKEGLSANATTRLRSLANLAARDPDVRYIELYDAQGAPLLGTASPRAEHFRLFPVALGAQAFTLEVGLPDLFLPPTTGPDPLAGLQGLLAGQEEAKRIAIAQIVAIILVGTIFTVLAIQFSIAGLSRRFIQLPSQRIRDVLGRMEKRRDYSERVPVEADDELGGTVAAFNRGLEFLETQNLHLNDSVIDLLESAGRISMSHDLTIEAPVKEDITGPVGDAINRLTREAARVFDRVRVIAEQVAAASTEVQNQGQRVVSVAQREQELIAHTTNELSSAIRAIDGIAELAQRCNEDAKNATASTDQALGSVRDTVAGMSGIRDTIQETGKRIKRLGERSQEISGIVDIINSFAERTHVLAINASMQAVSSGEAGKGFAVIAHEVQRLADSSRTATSQIGNLISNIQLETGETIQTVNRATEAVTEQSRIVERAGEQMQSTQQATTALAAAIRQIYDRSQRQAAANSRLLEEIQVMRSGTQETTEQLAEQTGQTTRLVEYSAQLMEAIQLFKLPKSEAPAVEATEGATAAT